MKLNIVTFVLVAVTAVVFGQRAATQPWTLWQTIGLSIAAPSLLLLVLARIQLGRAFSIRAKASTLVTTGLYSHSQSDLRLWRTADSGRHHLDRAPDSAALPRRVDSHTDHPRTQGIAGAGGEVRRGIRGVQAKDVVLSERRYGRHRISVHSPARGEVSGTGPQRRAEREPRALRVAQLRMAWTHGRRVL